MGKAKGETKRKREEGRESLEEVNPFAKSKKVGRSPSKTENSEKKEEGMDEVKEMLKKIIEDMGEMKKELKMDIEELKKDFNKKEEQWKKEKEEMKKIISDMERRMEAKEREERKKNVVITGLEMDGENMKGQVEKWIEKELGMKVEVKEARKINEGKMMVVKLRKWEEKRSVMMNKKKLREKKGSRVFIDDDLTKRERGIQKNIRERAKEERKVGNQARVGYKKIWVNGKWYKWNEDEENWGRGENFS